MLADGVSTQLTSSPPSPQFGHIRYTNKGLCAFCKSGYHPRLPPTFTTQKTLGLLNRKIIIPNIYPKLILSISVTDLRYVGFRASKQVRVTGNFLGCWVVDVLLKPIISL